MDATTTTAALIICHHSDDLRILKCFEGSGDRYYCASSETKKKVVVEKATTELLQKELAKLSIVIEDEKSIQLVADKFYEELTQRKGGKLAYSHDGKTHGFWRIVMELK